MLAPSTFRPTREPISGAESTNFTVVRVKAGHSPTELCRHVAHQSVGVRWTRGPESGVWRRRDFSFFDNVSTLGYVAKTQTPGRSVEDMSYQAQFTYAGDRYGLQADHLLVEKELFPGGGFHRDVTIFAGHLRPAASARDRWLDRRHSTVSGGGQL